MDNYEEQIQKMKQVVEKYKNLPLKLFLENTLKDTNYDLKRLNNVYIDEFVEFPNVWGCLKRDNKYITYSTNERAEVISKTYDDSYLFFRVFLQNSSFNNKYDAEINRNKHK